MFRRFLRIIIAVGLMATIGTYIFSRFRVIGAEISCCAVVVDRPGVSFVYFNPEFAPASYEITQEENSWRVRDAVGNSPLTLPRVGGGKIDARFLFIPWWFLLLAWVMLAILVWRWTRRRDLRHGFPVEAAETLS